MVELLRDGGTLIFPGTGLVFRVYKKERQMVLTNPEALRDPDSKDIFEKTKRVFRLALDYSVEVQQ